MNSENINNLIRNFLFKIVDLVNTIKNQNIGEKSSSFFDELLEILVLLERITNDLSSYLTESEERKFKLIMEIISNIENLSISEIRPEYGENILGILSSLEQELKNNNKLLIN